MGENKKLTTTSGIPYYYNEDSMSAGEIIDRQLCHFFRADIGIGMAVATALNINVEDVLPGRHTSATSLA